MLDPVQADHDDHDGCPDGHSADRHRLWSGGRVQKAAGTCRGWWAGIFTAPYALYYSRDLHLYGWSPGEVVAPASEIEGPKTAGRDRPKAAAGDGPRICDRGRPQ